MVAKHSICSFWITVCLLIIEGQSCAVEIRQVLNVGSNDVAGFVGGSDVAAASFTGHLEALLAVRFPNTRFRNFGWEGDTVFAQPRDFGFPPLSEHLKRAGVTVLFLEFGRAEALSSKKSVADFYAAYDKLISECARQTARLVLVTPPPFEAGGGSLPDLSKQNAQLAAHADAVRSLAQKRSLFLVDLFAGLAGTNPAVARLTDNGWQLTGRGNALVAAAFVRRLGFPVLASQPGEPDISGAWTHPQFEKLRQMAIEKNHLWFNYWRPQNWAFLGGDRITQPSSRDHLDPKVRWFPAEMEKYLPLIRAKEQEMERLAAQIRGGAEYKIQNPKSKPQTNSKSQTPTSSLERCEGCWDLEFGVFLAFGFWLLEFPPHPRRTILPLNSLRSKSRTASK